MDALDEAIEEYRKQQPKTAVVALRLGETDYLLGLFYTVTQAEGACELEAHKFFKRALEWQQGSEKDLRPDILVGRVSQNITDSKGNHRYYVYELEIQ